MSRRKHNVGHQVPQRIFFGMYDVDANFGVLQLVPNKTQATLFAVLQQYIRPGSIIHSDRAAMYVDNRYDPPMSHIENIAVNPPYQHVSVNHHEHFIDPASGACTNAVEGFWKNAKKKNKEMCGTTEELLPSYMDEFQWRQLFGKKIFETFDNILAQIAHYYPVNN